MSRTFYVDSATGSDQNSGEAGAAWASLDKVNSAAFQPGDTILFARGATFNGTLQLNASGAEGAPITIGAYGTGADPTFTGGANGIQGNGQDHIAIHNIHIANTSGAGIQTFESNDWVIDQVAIDHTGSAHVEGNLEFAAIQFWHGSDLTVANSTMTNINGDAMWIWDNSNVKILQNHVEVAQGPNADNLHMFGVHGYEVRGNSFSMEGDTDSGKGNFHSQAGDNGLVTDNVFRGGNYGVGNTDNNLTIENNEFFNHNKEAWSGAIIVSETYDVANNTIDHNVIHNANIGIYSYQDYARDNFNIHDNVFDGVNRAALLNEGRMSGSFVNNTIVGPDGTVPVEFDGWVPDGQGWDDSGNAVTQTMPAVAPVAAATPVHFDQVFPDAAAAAPVAPIAVAPASVAPAPAPAPVAAAALAPSPSDLLIHFFPEVDRNA